MCVTDSVPHTQRKSRHNYVILNPEQVNETMSRNELSQTDALELRNSGADYLMLGQYENAFKHFMKSLEYEPNKALTLRLLADAYYMLTLTLDMNGYQIGAAGATVLAKALESNSSLTSLNLQ